MRKLTFSVLLVALGAAAWVVLSRTARFSFKKWDAAFDAIVRHDLTSFGLTDQDVLSSVHEQRKDRRGEWVTHRMSLASLTDDHQRALAERLSRAGAQVDTVTRGRKRVLVVRRGSRVTHEITFARSKAR